MRRHGTGPTDCQIHAETNDEHPFARLSHSEIRGVERQQVNFVVQRHGNAVLKASFQASEMGLPGFARPGDDVRKP